MAESFIDLHDRALSEIRIAYQNAWDISHMPLDRLNSAREPGNEWRDNEEVLGFELACAARVVSFAVNIGLITPDEARDVISEFYTSHPEPFGEA